MLSILTAAETEQYENPRQREDADHNEKMQKLSFERDHYYIMFKEADQEKEKLKGQLTKQIAEYEQIKKTLEEEQKRY